MRKKFVQIAAIFLALTMLPTSFAAAETGSDSNAQPTVQVDTTVDAPSTENTTTDTLTSTEESSAADINSNPTATEPVGDASNPEQGTGESGGEGTDPEQGAMDPGGEGVNPEQGTTGPSGEATDPEQGATEPDGEGTNPEQETTEPEVVPDVPEVIVPVLESEEIHGNRIRVGLSFGSKAVSGGNLLNSVGSGYRFGFEDGSLFYKIGYTTETRISVLKTKNLYYSAQLSDGYSGYTETNAGGAAVGCVHLQIPGTYATFDETKAAADALGGFPVWVNGEFSVRVGVYLTGDEARAAQAALGLTDATVVGTSANGFTVVITGTSTPLFQYDGGTESPMFIVKPGLDDSVKTETYYKGYKYYGSFRYERINGGDITVVNLVDIDDYVRGVIPIEMSPSWPLEALKAQAVAARSYAVTLSNPNHSRNGFSVCTTECCQVYQGTNAATSHTDRAVDETIGQFACYNGKPILAVFHSSDGGATENCENVWFEALPYLRGVVDPYEALVADKINSYNWSKTYTGVQLQEILNAKGYPCAEIVDVNLKKTGTGNVYSVTSVDANGKSWTISKDSLRSTFGFRSLRFSMEDNVDDYVLSDSTTIESLNGVWTLNGNGELVQINISPVYAMTAEGVMVVPGSEMSGRTFVFNGTGRGHNLGMSQWGAYAMAKEGFTYDQILKFYFTGIEIHE